MNKFQEKKENLVKAIEIAIDVFQEFPPLDLEKNHIDHFIKVYLGYKNSVINPEPRYDNSKSLAYTHDDIFTFFQEATGETVDKFWEKITENNLPYKRENKLKKILKRKKIKNDIEYNFIIDVFVPYIQTGVINEEEIELINDMIAKFENR